MNNVVKYGIGLVGLAVTVYIVGVAWKRSQKNNSGAAGFAGATGKTSAATGKKCFCNYIRQDCSEPCPPRAS